MSDELKKYNSLEEIVEDIKKVKIQGATNVAIATFEGLKLFLRDYNGNSTYDLMVSDIEKAGTVLAYARPNEPLAKNGLRYVSTMLRVKYNNVRDLQGVKEAVNKLCDEYLEIIKNSKEQIITNSESVLNGVNEILTHCHSSTAEAVIINQSKRVENFKAVCAETRPLFQGRITATNLLNSGIDTTLAVDSAIESLIIGRGVVDVDVVFLGCDEITVRGDAINKIGSFSVALAAYFASKPVYVIGSLLKIDLSTLYKPVEIEQRNEDEVWVDAPEGLKIYNPAFEQVNNQFITGYITEAGVIKPDDLQKTVHEKYEWLY